MFEIIALFLVAASCFYQRFDLASFAMSIVVYIKLWCMVRDVNKILNRGEKE